MSSTTPLVVIGASAGGVAAVGRILSELPEELPAAVLVVLHVAPVENHLAHVFGRRANLHVEDGRTRVVRGPHENGHRPAIDALFRSAARARGPDVVAVVLTGSLDDGAAGSAAVSRLGGRVLVQDPAEAAFPADELETVPAPSELACPSCGGVLWEVVDDELRFRCRIGHAFGTDSLLVGQSEQLDRALAEALRALEERADVAAPCRRARRERGVIRRGRWASWDLPVHSQPSRSCSDGSRRTSRCRCSSSCTSTRTTRASWRRSSPTCSSLAVSYGHGALAVILSGAGHDGAARAAALRLAGGTVVAQDGETSEYFGMSGAAIEEGAVDLIEPLREIGSAVVGFARA